jgi:hypothetical protein
LAPGLNPTESLSLLDALVKAAGIALADTASPADATSFSHGFGLLLQDPVALSDAVHDALALALADIASVQDSSARQVGFARSLADSITLVDAVRRAAATQLVESIILSDALAKQAALGIADPAAVADAIARTWVVIRVFADAVALAEAIKTRRINESLGWFETDLDLRSSLSFDSGIELIPPP